MIFTASATRLGADIDACRCCLPSERGCTSATVLSYDFYSICKRRCPRPIALPFAAHSKPCDRNDPCLHHSPNRHVVSFRRYATRSVRNDIYVVAFVESMNRWHRQAHLGPKRGQDQLFATGPFHEVHNPFVLPGVDVCPIDRCLIGKYILKTLYDFSTSIFEHRGQNNRNIEGFGELCESDHVIHDHGRLVTMKVCELKGLVINQDDDGFLRGQQSRKPRQL